MILEVGLWKLDIDVEGTRDYHKRLVIEESDPQSCQNYRAYCKVMNGDEKEFFQKIGVQPEKCNVNTIGMKKDKTYPTFGRYFIKGSFLYTPKEYSMPLDEFINNGMSIDIGPEYENGSNIIIGNYEIRFLWKDSLFHPQPDDLLEGFIGMDFFAQNIPWLLKEKPIHVLYELPKWWEIHKRIKEFIYRKKAIGISNKEFLINIKKDFRKQQVRYKIMPERQVKAFKKCWFDKFTPTENRKQARKVCFSNGGFSNYLWHLFSYKFAECIDGKAAISQYNEQEKAGCYLLLNSCDIGIKIEPADRFRWTLFC